MSDAEKCPRCGATADCEAACPMRACNHCGGAVTYSFAGKDLDVVQGRWLR